MLPARMRAAGTLYPIDGVIFCDEIGINKRKHFNCSSSSSLFPSLDDDGFENAHSSAAYALSNSYHSRNGGHTENGSNGQSMTSHGRRVKHTTLHRLEKQQDEFYQL